MPPFETIIYEKRGPVALIRLDRPHVHNAFNTVMRDDLHQALEAVRDDNEVTVVLLSAEGKNFCAGADLTEFGSAPSIVAARDSRWRRDLWGLFLNIEKPIVAAIHGHCIGSGLEMALLCDIRIASTDASFAMPEAKLGLIPAAGGTQTLPRILGPGRALHLLLTGSPISAQTALGHGLVTRLSTPAGLQGEALAFADCLASLDPAAVSALKQSLNLGIDLPLPQALQLETRLAANLALRQRTTQPFLPASPVPDDRS